jgi:hypothetical protein
VYDSFILIPRESQFSVPESQDCHLLPDVMHVLTGQEKIISIFRICGQIFSDSTSCILYQPEGSRNKENKGVMTTLAFPAT